jgi:hypothetical protein
MVGALVFTGASSCVVHAVINPVKARQVMILVIDFIMCAGRLVETGIV